MFKILKTKARGYLLILSVLFNVTSQTVCAQSKSDSKTAEVKEQITAADFFLNKANYDTAIILCNKALISSQKLNYKAGQAKAYDVLAEIMFKNGKMNDAEQYNLLAAPLATELKDTGLLINIKNRTGLYLLEKGKNKEAEQNFTTALNLGANKLTQLKKAEINSNLGSLYLALGEKEKALQYFLNADKLYENINNAKGLGETYSNIASVYYLMGNIDDAIEFQKKSIVVREAADDKSGLVITNNNISQMYILKGNYDLSLKHIKQSIALAEQIKNPKLQAASYAGMSVYNIRVKNFAEALVWQNKSIKLFEQIDDKNMLSRLYISAGNLANAGKDSLQAITYLNKGLSLSENLYNKENIANAYEKLSAFYLSHNEYEKAYVNYKKFILYRDSVTVKSNLSKIEEIKTQYETEKKDNEIVKLNTLQRLKQLQIEKQDAVINGNLIEAEKKQNEIELLSKEKQLQDFKIYQQNDEIEKQTLVAKNKEQQLQINIARQQIKDKQLKNETKIKNLWIGGLLGGLVLAILLALLFINRYKLKKKLEQQYALIAIRNTISQDLHDEIGSTLTSINILSNVTEKAIENEPVQAKEMLHQIAVQSKTIQQNMSDIVWSIRPENEKVENLLIRIREYAAQTLEPLDIAVTVDTDERLINQILPIEFRKELLLICKEAINNIVKHAGATKVAIAIKKDKQQIQLNISDNGVWKGNTSGTGTKSMKARANIIGGKFAIATTPTGTAVTVNIPLP
ncbi:tetratricopeptide repeat-containing sensor histidine kinase [Ferruginibacter sp.]|nr:tetratricopeptide repeat protein [Ferruginibacter sp.]